MKDENPKRLAADIGKPKEPTWLDGVLEQPNSPKAHKYWGPWYTCSELGHSLCLVAVELFCPPSRAGWIHSGPSRGCQVMPHIYNFSIFLISIYLYLFLSASISPGCHDKTALRFRQGRRPKHHHQRPVQSVVFICAESWVLASAGSLGHQGRVHNLVS